MSRKYEVKSIGSYFSLDEEGFIINPTSIQKLQAKWAPAVEQIKEEYLIHFGSRLHSVYIRGSVAKGEALDGISDIDSFAVVELPRGKVDMSWSREFSHNLVFQYPFIIGVETVVIPMEEFAKNRARQILIKTQSICIYGENLAESISPMKPGEGVAQHTRYIERDINRAKKWLEDKHYAQEIRRQCSRIMRRLLRSGFEITMERSKVYTRDLYPCYEGFSTYYPDKKDDMYRVLELAINPTENATEISGILDGIGAWLIDEVRRIIVFKDDN